MKRKWKIALAALLGFSTACSTVKKAPADKETPEREAADSTAKSAKEGFDGMIRTEEVHRIRLMYGVPSPRPTAGEPVEEVGGTKPETGTESGLKPASGTENGAPAGVRKDE